MSEIITKNPIIFERSEGNKWVAYLKNNPEIRAEADSKAKAVGFLYMLNTDRVRFVVGQTSDDNGEEDTERHSLPILEEP